MKTFQNQKFENTQVILDNNEFLDCSFDNCSLVYTGVGKVFFQRCKFGRDIQWAFSGPAANTIQFMNATYHGLGEGGKELVEKTFDNIRRPPIMITPK